jgi:dihydroflavonol-4-reductase
MRGTRVTVTGASGHIGGTLVRALLAEGAIVRAADLHRSPALDGLDVEFTTIDVLDPSTLPAAFAGADVVFHLAAIISIVGDPTGMVRRVNVDGAHNAAQAALDAGVGRYLHCSSVHAFDLELCGPSLDESGPRTVGVHAPAYDRSKYAAEQRVRGVIEAGLDAVIVNPSGVFGPFDFGRSRMGETITQLRDGKIPVNIGGGFDFVDVRDVAAGMIGAVRHGRTGENYLLSGTRLTVKELGVLVAQVTGRTPPRVDVPLGLVAPFAGLVLRLTPKDRIPIFTPESVHALRYSPTVSHYKAATELGYVARPAHVTVADTLDWWAAYDAGLAGRATGA